MWGSFLQEPVLLKQLQPLMSPAHNELGYELDTSLSSAAPTFEHDWARISPVFPTRRFSIIFSQELAAHTNFELIIGYLQARLKVCYAWCSFKSCLNWTFLPRFSSSKVSRIDLIEHTLIVFAFSSVSFINAAAAVKQIWENKRQQKNTQSIIHKREPSPLLVTAFSSRAPPYFGHTQNESIIHYRFFSQCTVEYFDVFSY